MGARKRRRRSQARAWRSRMVWWAKVFALVVVFTLALAMCMDYSRDNQPDYNRPPKPKIIYNT